MTNNNYNIGYVVGPTYWQDIFSTSLITGLWVSRDNNMFKIFDFGEILQDKG